MQGSRLKPEPDTAFMEQGMRKCFEKKTPGQKNRPGFLFSGVFTVDIYAG
jgi:hypothetical protein